MYEGLVSVASSHVQVLQLGVLRTHIKKGTEYEGSGWKPWHVAQGTQ